MVRMSNDAIEDMVKVVVGREVLLLVKLLRNKKNVSEFKLADKLKVNVNNVRNLLYKLGEYTLVNSIRKKDKKKGWYIYYWTFDEKRARALLIEFKENRLKELEEELEGEKGSYFFNCPNACARVTFENALENEFKCEECGCLLVQEDNDSVIKRIKREMTMIRNELVKARTVPKKRARRKPAKKKTPKRKPAKKKVARKKPVRKKPVKRKPVKRKPRKKSIRRIFKRKARK